MNSASGWLRARGWGGAQFGRVDSLCGPLGIYVRILCFQLCGGSIDKRLQEGSVIEGENFLSHILVKLHKAGVRLSRVKMGKRNIC